MKNEQNAQILHDISMIFPRNIFSGILRAILGSESESERIRPQHHPFTGAIVLNKPFMRLHTLLYSISLDA